MSESKQQQLSGSHSSAPIAAPVPFISSTSSDANGVRVYPNVHSFMVNNSKFVVDSKYSPLKPLGRGAYGVVCSAVDKNTGKKVAIKKIPKAFEDLIDAKRILREVKLLRHFRHENVITLRDLQGPVEDEIFDDVYIVLDYMETDLHKIIYSKNDLTDEHIQYFLYQILKGMKYIHSAKVIHRDLKPSNLLLNGNCDLKICDFGLARGTNEDEDYDLTEYVVTRWYRAPEVMCSCQQYDYKIDVWSIGCILAELHGRKPIFPGDDYIKQMNLIFSILGTPAKEDMKFITNAKALDYIKNLKKRNRIPFSELYPKANPLGLDLLEKMLEFNPEKRISIDDALAHPYLKALHNVKYEVECKRTFNFDFEKLKLGKSMIQQLMWDEIATSRPELKGRRQFAKKPTMATTTTTTTQQQQTTTTTTQAAPASGEKSALSMSSLASALTGGSA